MDAYPLTKLALDFLAPAARATTDSEAERALLRALGFELPDGVSLLNGAGDAAQSLTEAALALADLTDDVGEEAWSAALTAVVKALWDAVDAVRDFEATLSSSIRNSPFVSGTDVLQVLPWRLMDYLTASLVERRWPFLYELLIVVGVIEETDVDPQGQPHRVPYTRRTVIWDRLPKIVTDPLSLLQQRYGWAATAIEADLLVRDLRAIAVTLGLRAELQPIDRDAKAAFDAVLSAGRAVPGDPHTVVARLPLLPLAESPLGVEIYPVADADGDSDGVGVGVYVDPTAGVTVPITDALRAELALGGQPSGFGFIFQRGEAVRVVTTVFGSSPASVLADADLEAHLKLVYEPPGADGIVVAGRPAATHFSLDSIDVAVGFATAPGRAADVSADLGLHGGKLVVRAAEGDGFLSKVLGQGFTAGFDLGIGFSTQRGLHFSGSGELEITIGIHQGVFGVLFIDLLHVGVAASETGLTPMVAVTVRVALGPVKVSVEKVGLAARLDFGTGGAEALGAGSLGLGFRPPDGAGVVIDGAAVTGGGYLLADHAQGRYGGILQLEVAETLSVTAIGLLATRLPGGHGGFSLLIIIAAEFPPIQLGFGFTLNGLGGLLGANRSMNVEALRNGVRTGVLDSILFPKDPVANAARVIRDVETVFPVTEGQFVIGLMAALGWGSPSLVTAQIGLVIELPSPIRIALLGRVGVVLPKEDAAIVVLHVDVVGVLDLAARELSVDATLRDSRVAAFSITGDFALRLNFGAAPAFAISCGGFNPRFTPPPGFPALRRVAIALATSENPRLRLEAYLASTPTSVQLGARLDVYAEVDFGGLIGRWSADAFLSFDALVHLVPRLRFIVDIAGGAGIRRNSALIVGAELYLTLEGPEPFHAVGHAALKFLWWEIQIGFDATIGEEPPPPFLPPGDPIGDLLAALGTPGNWEARPPADAPSVVSLRDSGGAAGDELLVHPFGSLSYMQRVVPLDVGIDTYAGAPPPSGAGRLSVKLAVGGVAASGAERREGFPAGQYFALTDEERLAAEAFPRLVCGHGDIALPTAGTTAPPPVTGADGYQTAVANPAARRSEPAGTGYAMAAATLDALVAGGAAARAPTRATGSAAYAAAPLGIDVAEASYRIVATDDLTAADAKTYTSVREAAAAAGDGVQVVGAHEAVPA